MLDIKKIRKDPDFTKEKLATRGVKPETIDELLSFDAKRRDLIVESESLKAQRNDVSDQISQKKRNKEDASEAINQMKQVGQKIKALDDQLRKIEDDENNLAAHLPNIPHDGVPVSLTEEGSVELRKVGQIPSFGFNPKHHWEIGEDWGFSILNELPRYPEADLFTTSAMAHYWNERFTIFISIKIPLPVIPK